MKKIIQLLFILQFCALNSIACSIFMANEKNQTYVGNNEDYIDVNSDLHFVNRKSKDSNGYLYFSFSDGFPQGGMNTKGLFFDITATPFSEVEFSKGLPAMPGA